MLLAASLTLAPPPVASVQALPEVLALTKTATERKVKILALRGAIRLIPLQNVSVL